MMNPIEELRQMARSIRLEINDGREPLIEGMGLSDVAVNRPVVSTEYQHILRCLQIGKPA